MKLNDLFPNWLTTGGIFTALSTNRDMPWDDDDQVTPLALDITYHGTKSGSKEVTRFVKNLTSNGALSSANLQAICDAIYAVYYRNWLSLYDALMVEYNPLWNVDGTETETTAHGHKIEKEYEGEETNTDETQNYYANKTTHGKAGSEKTEYTPLSTTTETTSKQGLNSSSFNPAEQTITTPGGEKNTTELTYTNRSDTEQVENLYENGQVKKDGTHQEITKSFDDRKDTEQHSGSDTVTLVRHGNIGVTSTQHLANEELELRKNSYFDRVFKDLDNFLTIKIF